LALELSSGLLRLSFIQYALLAMVTAITREETASSA